MDCFGDKASLLPSQPDVANGRPGTGLDGRGSLSAPSQLGRFKKCFLTESPGDSGTKMLENLKYAGMFIKITGAPVPPKRGQGNAFV